ncbi:hypothetical protein [Synergistes jonesii]|uniref:hypothetical protein n=1 Tax=Synergistes jonesii TaxID=2754 RepID=UPI003327CE98
MTCAEEALVKMLDDMNPVCGDKIERALLLFDEEFPCWDEETFALAGEDFTTLKKLCEIGLLAEAGCGYVLTAEGGRVHAECSERLELPARQIGDFDAEEALWNNRLYLLMDRAFVGQFGIKEYSVNEPLSFAPYLKREELWKIEDGRVKYIWREAPLVRSLLATFPRWGVAARKFASPGSEGMIKWVKEAGASIGELRFNLLLRSRYDFELYRKEAPLPEDVFRMKDADRLFFFRAKEGRYDEIYDAIGRLHIFMLDQRRVYIPGYADIDAHEQENWTMFVVAAESERELESVAERLARDGKNLIEPAAPLFIIGTSMERLRRQEEPEDTIYDWFCDRSVHIVRPDV